MSIPAVCRQACLAMALAAAGALTRADAQVSTPARTPTPTVVDTFPKALCPRATASRHLFRGLDSAAIDFAEANGYNHWCIPEYHDDQRFSMGSAGNPLHLGPLAHTLASPQLGAITSHAGFDAGWVNVALVDVEDPVTPMPAPYRALGLMISRSCMYLRHDHGGAAPTFVGLMVTAPSSGVCPTTPDRARGQLLGVTEEAPVAGEAEYPPVTRFVEWGSGQTAVGVRCGDHWCNVGARDVPRPAHAAVGALSASSRGVVKGWFDDQLLAVRSSTAPHGLQRAARASVIPDPGLGDVTIARFLEGYQRVATAYFPSAPPKKYERAGFGQGSTSIELRATRAQTAAGADTLIWTARLTNGRSSVIRKVFRTDHSHWLSSMPATARWRWNARDEDLWVACAVGCCRVYLD